MPENIFRITGTIYAKEFQEIKGKKDPSAVYAKNIITLEVSTSRDIPDKKGGTRYVTVTEYPQFEAFGLNMDDYNVGDLIELRFHLSGRKYTNKYGKECIMTKAMIDYVKFADIEGGHSSKSNTGGFGKPFPKRDDTFTPPDPDTDDTMQDLPF